MRELVIPDLPLTRYVFEEDRGDRTAVIEGPTGRELSYAELVGAIGRVAGNLAGLGVGKGDVVAIQWPNTPEYIVAFHGIASAGAVSTTLNPLSTTEEVARQLENSGARMLLTVPTLLESARAAADDAGVETIFVLGGEGPAAEAGTEDGPALLPFDRLLEPADPPDVEIDPAGDLVVLPYSSGTTGMPKGVMLTHRNLVANVAQVSAADPAAAADEVAIAILPFFHIYGLTALMNWVLRRGGTLVTLPRFELEVFLETLERYEVERALLVPPIVLALAKHPLVDEHDLSALCGILSGAAPLDAELAQACGERLGCTVVQGYGLTETSPVTHVTPSDPGRNRPGKVGPPVPGTEVRIVDVESGEDLGPGEEGEVVVRGPQVMRGYLGQPQATAEMIDEDGWLHTGDVGFEDEDGYLTLVDRVKELIKYKGYQVPPAELEAVLLSHPGIADAAVIGVPDEEAGEIPVAYVVPSAPGGDVGAPEDGTSFQEEIIEHVAGRVAPYKKVRRVEVVEEIPKSASGKILRRVLRDRAAE